MTYVGSLNNFETVGLSATLASSSDIIGDTNAILEIYVDPETVLSSTGTLVVNFPEYYENSQRDQMIG